MEGHPCAVNGALDFDKTTTGVTLKLLAYCRSNQWAGHDPYDALNTRLLTALPFLDTKPMRLILIQALKRSPVNVRQLLLVPKTQNAKAIGLFLRAVLKLSKLGILTSHELPDHLVERAIALRSPGSRYWCWGYSFPWQTRGDLVPRGAPNLVCTSFVADALFDAFESGLGSRCLEMAVSAAEYFLDQLYWSDSGSVAAFCYPRPGCRNPIHNASLLGAALLCRAFRLTGARRFLQPALNVARYAVEKQRADGSWTYGELRTQQWIDNFHTGFNLCSLRGIARDLRTDEFDTAIRRGLEFYRAHFFEKDGTARYFHNRVYPIDIHSIAQSIITLSTVGGDEHEQDLRLAGSVLHWALMHMWNPRGYFYYRALRLGTIRISYMRWAQAWMLLALAVLQDAIEGASAPPISPAPVERCSAV
jgi:hypothetical protein